MSTSTIGFEEDMSQGSDYGRDAILRRLGELAKRRREELGMGRVTLAKQAGIGSDATVQSFEFGQRVPHGKTTPKLERALGWRQGAIGEFLEDRAKRRASSIQMEELDSHDSVLAGVLANISTAQLLEEVIKRLSALQSGIGAPTRDLYGLAASGGHKPEHLDEGPDDDLTNLNISPN